VKKSLYKISLQDFFLKRENHISFRTPQYLFNTTIEGLTDESDTMDFLNLPPEVQLLVLGFLDLPDLLRVRLVRLAIHGGLTRLSSSYEL